MDPSVVCLIATFVPMSLGCIIVAFSTILIDQRYSNGALGVGAILFAIAVFSGIATIFIYGDSSVDSNSHDDSRILVAACLLIAGSFMLALGTFAEFQMRNTNYVQHYDLDEGEIACTMESLRARATVA